VMKFHAITAFDAGSGFIAAGQLGPINIQDGTLPHGFAVSKDGDVYIGQSGKKWTQPPDPGDTCQGAAVTVGGATDGNNTINGTTGDDVINGLGGDDTINGLGGNDKICGGAGFDTASGGLGNDSLEGEALEYGRSATGVSVDLAAGRATGEGTDTLLGGAFSEVYGSPHPDAITGNAKNNYLGGLGGNDTITGGPGNDWMLGEDGADTINSRDGGVADTGGLWAAASGIGVHCGNGVDTAYVDAQGDTTSLCESVHRPVTPDTTAPRGTVKIDGGRAVTTDRTVRLTLRASDPAPGSGVASMRVKNAGGAWKAWQPYATSRWWMLSGKAGKKVVYVQYRDGAGNVSVMAKDSISYRP